jgi:putative peptidoglycan lipid II flippase
MVELIPYAVTGALLGALGAVLAVKRRFAITALVLAFEPILKSVLLLLFSKQLGAQALIIGNLVGNGLAVVVLWLVVSKDGVSLRLAAFYTSPTVRRIFRLSIPLVVSQSVIQLNPLIDRAAAAGLGRGTVTEFELGVRLFTAPATLLAATLVAPLAATWSTRFAEDGWGAVTKSFSRVIAALVIVVPPIIVTGFVLRDEIVRVAYSSHAFTPEAVQHTADVLGVLLIGLLAQVIVVPVSTLFIVRGNTVFPMKVGIANCVINALLDVALRGPLGVTGIALSTTVTLSVLCAIYVWQAQVRWGPLGLGSALRKPATVSAVSCAAIAFWALGSSQVATSGSRWVELAAICGIGAVGVAVHFGAVTLTRAWPGTARRAGSRARWIGATPG